MVVELRKVNINEGLSDETTCFSAEIWVDGSLLSTVGNRGCGGPHEYGLPNLPIDKNKFEAFERFCNDQPHKYAFDITDQYVDKLLEEYESNQWLTKKCRGRTLFRLVGDEKGKWRTIKFPYSEEIKKYLQTKYGAQVEAIGNELI